MIITTHRKKVLQEPFWQFLFDKKDFLQIPYDQVLGAVSCWNLPNIFVPHIWHFSEWKLFLSKNKIFFNVNKALGGKIEEIFLNLDLMKWTHKKVKDWIKFDAFFRSWNAACCNSRPENYSKSIMYNKMIMKTEKWYNSNA